MKDLATRTPVNKTAACVIAKGIEYECPKTILTADSALPIPTRPVPRNTENLTGQRRGRLEVIGLAQDANGRWVARCDCGTYTLRKAKALKNADNDGDRCEECRHLLYAKRSDYWRRTGKDADDQDMFG